MATGGLPECRMTGYQAGRYLRGADEFAGDPQQIKPNRYSQLREQGREAHAAAAHFRR